MLVAPTSRHHVPYANESETFHEGEQGPTAVTPKSSLTQVFSPESLWFNMLATQQDTALTVS